MWSGGVGGVGVGVCRLNYRFISFEGPLRPVGAHQKRRPRRIFFSLFFFFFFFFLFFFFFFWFYSIRMLWFCHCANCLLTSIDWLVLNHGSVGIPDSGFQPDAARSSSLSAFFCVSLLFWLNWIIWMFNQINLMLQYGLILIVSIVRENELLWATKIIRSHGFSAILGSPLIWFSNDAIRGDYEHAVHTHTVQSRSLYKVCSEGRSVGQLLLFLLVTLASAFLFFGF